MDRTPDFEALTSKRGNNKAKRHTPLGNETTSLVTRIKKMKLYLTQHGHDYLNTYGHLPGASIMTEERRNNLDLVVEAFIDKCEEEIKSLQAGIRLEANSEQEVEHRETMLKIVRRILNDLFKHFNHLKTTKIRRNVEKENYDKILCSLGELSPGKEFESIDSDILNADNLASIVQEEKLGTSVASLKTNNSYELDDWQHQSMIAAEHETSISKEELQKFASENSQIHEELMTLDDEVKLIGKKVAQISKLQELFTEKVMEQALDLNNLHETAIKSSENVREGNDLIRDAMMKNASTRVFILFYIITLGFTILFLDWYNP